MFNELNAKYSEKCNKMTDYYNILLFLRLL